MIKRFTVIAAFIGVSAVSGQSVTAEELSVGTFVPHSHETNDGMFKWFGEEIEARSGGTLTMKLYPAGQLGAGPVQQYKRAIEGVADITFGVAALTPTIFPKTMLAILPGKAKNPVDSTERLWAIYDEYLADEWSEVKVLAIGNPAGSLLVGNRNVSTMEGMKGAKIVSFCGNDHPCDSRVGSCPGQVAS